MAEILRSVHDGHGLELVLDVPVGAVAGASALLGRAEVRKELLSALTSLPAEVRSVLIRGAIPGVFSGPDLPEAEDSAEPTFNRLCEAMAACPVPVAILLEGTASGRGAEFLLSAQRIFATPKARIGFSSLSLGLLPGAGATQRLPRRIGAEQALRLFSGGRAIPAAEALAIGLLDGVLDHDKPEAVLEQLRADLMQPFSPVPAPGLRDGRAFLQAVAAARSRLGSAPLPAETAVIDCVEAAMLLPETQGMALEATLAEEIAHSPEASALTYLHRAELRATRAPAGLETLEPEPVRHLGVAGADPALAGLVLTALSRGVVVKVADPVRDRLVAFLKTVAARQEAAVQARQMTPAQRDADWARLSPVPDALAMENADLILATPGAALPAPRKGRPVLYFGRGEVGAEEMRLHLLGRVGELALPPTSSGPAVMTAWAFLRRLGVQVVVTGRQTQMGIARRLSVVGGAAIKAMQDMGVSAGAIRTALTEFGLPAPEAMPQDSQPLRQMNAAEIRARWLGALANEGARLLQSGMVRLPSDVDLVAVAGLGFPRRMGGPLHQADRRGLLILRRDLSAWAADAPVWEPVAALDGFVSLGRGFAGAVTPE